MTIPERFRATHGQHIQGFARTGVTARSIFSPGRLFALRADGEEFPIETAISQVESDGEKLFTVIVHEQTRPIYLPMRSATRNCCNRIIKGRPVWSRL